MKTGPTLQTGARGDMVASRNAFGNYIRKRPARTKLRNKVRTPGADRAEAAWRAISASWNRLTEEQYRAWAIAAEGERTRPRGGQSGRMPTRTLFFKVNMSRTSLGLPLVSVPPAPVDANPNPVRQLQIANRGDRVVMRLELSEPVSNTIKLYATSPQNRGTTRGRDYRALGCLLPPRHGECDITQIYVGRFGVPEPGKRVFVRTVVEVNGKQTSPLETQCLVPERRRPTGSQLKPKALWVDPDV